MLLQGGENVAKKQTNGNLALEQQRVIVIPAHDEFVARKLRVAAYARVSSSSEDQLNSYRVQNQYYSELISSNPDWEMVDIYADEGITGTSVEKREDFQRMMQDCRKGKIDRILVKSISRFARNTKDCLAAVRELKELGVSVQFEEQGIDTSKVSSEMVTAIMASLAQKQSESISGNVKWGVQKRIQDKTFVTCKEPYGYRLVDRRLCIVESEAIIVRMIYEKYLAGISMEFIRDQLNIANIPFRENERQRGWTRKAISYILSNEKYIGDSLWQKTYSGDTFPHTQRKNKGILCGRNSCGNCRKERLECGVRTANAAGWRKASRNLLRSSPLPPKNYLWMLQFIVPAPAKQRAHILVMQAARYRPYYLLK